MAILRLPVMCLNFLNRFCLLLCASLLATGALADTSAPCHKPLRVALFEFGVLYNKQSNDGVDARLLKELSRRSGCTLDLAVLPRQRIWAELEAGSVDVATAVLPTPEREQLGYLVPYLRSRNLFLMRADKGRGIAKLSGFTGQPALRLGVVRGFRHEPDYDALIAQLRAQGRVVEAADVGENLRNLAKGAVDGVISQPLVYRAYLRQLGLADKLVVRDWIPKDQFAIGAMLFSKKAFTAQEAQRWAELIDQLRNDGTLLKINSRFLPAGDAADMIFWPERGGAGSR